MMPKAMINTINQQQSRVQLTNTNMIRSLIIVVLQTINKTRLQTRRLARDFLFLILICFFFCLWELMKYFYFQQTTPKYICAFLFLFLLTSLLCQQYFAIRYFLICGIVSIIYISKTRSGAAVCNLFRIRCFSLSDKLVFSDSINCSKVERRFIPFRPSRYR